MTKSVLKAELIMMFSLLFFTSCIRNPGTLLDDDGDEPGSGKVRITVTTRPLNGTYPDFAFAAWMENSNGSHIRTLKVYGSFPQYMNSLVDWTNSSGEYPLGLEVDGWSGASLPETYHGTPITMTWNLKDKNGSLVTEGTYWIRVEATEENSHLTGTADSKNGNLQIIIGTNAATNSSNSVYIDVSAVYTPKVI